ncbi:tyrosine-type recombinase/integrase [Tenacibaculum soleae]|uniref:tyrosine-type recombinase/integrase n=1 Tax=Tenacibaculum soleae TaxID=447689 RepID=UPI0026E3A541|nr:tyrosine-type recombinase/integrase [Tenacibaculum soleae]MDO6813257.1 tyrosine-type recombinase/integrase [Tenacibaculum soleae]
MKSLTLYNQSFIVLVHSFQGWLTTLGYAESTSSTLPNHLKEFFCYLESKGHEGIGFITTKLVSEYYHTHLSIRKNTRRGGALGNRALNKHQQALKLFLKYLKEHGAKYNFGVHLRTEKAATINVRDLLSQDQVRQLFNACDWSHISKKYQLRDKAILVVLYACGLRRNEAIHININHVNFDKRELFVAKGKNYKSRFIPLNDFSLKILEEYIYDARPQFNKDTKTSDSLFLNKFGGRMLGKTFSDRLHKIIEATEDEIIMSKKITLHTLRHCLATHLLEKGMKLEDISRLLGHSSLESTQIYVHLLDKLKEDE